MRVTLVRFYLDALSGAAKDFWRHGCTSLAASLAFFSLLSFFPMIFMILYFVSFVVSQERLADAYFLTFLHGFFPSIGAELINEVQRIASEQIVHWLVFLTFFWFGLLVFYEVTYAVNVVFERPKRRNPLVSTSFSMGLLFLTALLMIASYGVTQVLTLVETNAPHFARLDVIMDVANALLLSYLLPFLVMIIVATCLYRYLPANGPGWQPAAVGGTILALLWEGAKYFFTQYVDNLAVYGRMYGSLLVVVVFLLYVYYSAVLFLYGAAVVHRLETPAQQI